MLSAPIRRRALLLALAGSAISGAAANAQFTWAVPGTDGSWNLNTNWNPLGIPNSGGATANVPASNPYTVQIESNVTVNTLGIGTQATVALANSRQLTFNSPNAGITNEGVFVINASGGALGTNLLLQNTNVALTGTGTLIFNADVSALDSASVTWWGGGERLTNGPFHTIRGTGRIRTYFTNDGTVNADTAGASLWLSDRDKINNGTIKASNGGQIQLTVRMDQDPGAVFRAESGSTVSIASSLYNGSVGTSGTGVMQFTGGSSIGSNTFFGNVGIVNGVTVYIEAANIVNNGTFTINPAAAAVGTALTLRNGNTELSGTGTLRLNAELATHDSAQISWWGGGERLTNIAGHSIRGTGRIRTHVTNNSLIAADVSGGTLWLSDQPKVNSAIMEATGGSLLYFTANAAQDPTGLIRCDSSSAIQFQGCNLSSGTVTAAPGGSITFTGSATVSNNPVFNGAVRLPANNTMYFEATGMTNNGTVTVNPTGENFGTALSLRNGNGHFTGPGTVVLNANAASLDTAQISWWGSGEVVTNGASHTFRGTGRIRTFMVNEGTVSADVNGATLWLSDQPKTNNNMVRATGGGNLTATSAITQGAAGRIVAENGSTVLFSGNTVAGGELRSNGTGRFNAQASNHLQSLTSNADLRVLPGNTMYVDGGSTITNNGTITVGDTPTAGAAYLAAVNGPIAFLGTGALVLAASGGDHDAAHLTWWSSSEVVTNGPLHTIRGVGRIRTHLTNDGTVSADVAGTDLWFSDQPKVNNNLIRAVNGAAIVSTCAVNQSATGRIQMFDGSVMTWSGGSLNGGSLESGGNGSYATSGSAYLRTFTNNSRINLLPGHTTYTDGNNIITNNGIMKIGDAASGATAVYTMQNGNPTLLGNGSLILDANPSNLDLAQIGYWSSSEVLTNGASHTIGGTGRIRTLLTNNGNLTPGPLGGGIGNIWKSDTRLTFAAGGRLNIEIASPTSFDKISGNAPLTLGGDLQVNLINGYTGGVGTTYEIVRGSSITGTFNVLDSPDHPTAGLKYGVQYTGNSVLLRVTCNADFNSDGVIDLFDYLDFVDVFSTGVPDSDYNADGVVDLFDYLDYVDQFAAGCN